MVLQFYGRDQDSVELYLCFPHSLHSMHRNMFAHLLLIGFSTLVLRFCHSIKYVLLVCVMNIVGGYPQVMCQSNWTSMTLRYPSLRYYHSPQISTLNALNPTGCSNYFVHIHLYIHTLTTVRQFHTMRMTEGLDDCFIQLWTSWWACKARNM
jgi:hypothetical protein